MNIFSRFSLLLCLPYLLTLSPALLISSDAQAQADCQQSSSKRRRPGQRDNCVSATPATGPVTATTIQTQAVTNNTAGRSELTERVSGRLPQPLLGSYEDAVPLPDRWRIVDTLGYQERWYDPYNRNVLKADRPVFGTEDWFFNLGIVSDTVYENRKVPITVGGSSSARPGQVDILGDSQQWAVNQNFAVELVYYKGDTTFKPPTLEFRLIPVFNYNYVNLEEVQGVNANPADGVTRNDQHMGLQGAFIDYHIRDVSDNYDFDSIRVGIQPYNADFRGFLFQDSPFGVRLFGTRNNNFFQYNIAWFRRLEKDTNSGLNDHTQSMRNDDVFTANVYWQDFLKLGFFSQFSILYNRNREDEITYDNNDFIVRPASIGRERLREYDVTYLGYSADGHIDRVNITGSFYWALGKEEGSLFRLEETAINAWFLAVETSVDFDWIRLRFSGLHASGDDDPYDDTARGFDAVFENPQFAGADSSYWIRQGMPFINGGRVALSSRNGILANLRSSKEQGQSNFTNPGLNLLGLGADFDVLPELRLSANWNYLRFAETDMLDIARNQADIDAEIGHDVSISAIYRPWQSQNIVLRASYAVLFSGDGYKDLYADEDPHYVLLNAVLTY